MSYLEIAQYLRPEYPRYSENDSTVGNVYLYVGPETDLEANKPKKGDVWADGRTVQEVLKTPELDNSDYSELTVTTTWSFPDNTDDATFGSVLDGEPRYQLRWAPQDLPLMQHPQFRPGGTSDLSVMAGVPPRTGYADIQGWEQETDSTLKGLRKYNRITLGVVTGPIMTVVPDTGGIAFIKLRQLGFESYTVFNPVWTKVSTYSGRNAPTTNPCGDYVAAPDGVGFPEGYDWIKTADSAERIGTKAKWLRTEEWTGGIVYYDKDTLNPAGHTLP